jgi:LruC domain-containing protein
MKISNPKYYLISLLTLLINACQIPELENNITEDNPLNTIVIPEGFDFSTHHEVQINIVDNAEYVKYDVFAYSSEPGLVRIETFENESGEIVVEPVYKNEVMDKLIFTGVPKNGILNQTINLPKYYNSVYIRRKDNLRFSSSIVNIVNQEVDYIYFNNLSSGQSKVNSQVADYLYCVNGSGELFQVDPLSGVLTFLSNMPMGSWTCAIDQENKVLYSIGRSSPFPLMKYSIENDTWVTVANLHIGGPRLDFNTADGLLYFSKNDKLYTFNPENGVNLNTWDIIGLHNTNGGDLAFAEDGTLYLCTFSGLYGLELDTNNDYQSTRISADNLPFQPTSMTFDSNQELWLANNGSSSNLILMDTQTGGWHYQYGISAGNNTNLGRTINDLTTFRVTSEIVDNTDTDGDGIIDSDDAFPEDPEIAFEHFTPSKYGTGTIAFEDLWPSTGDYDFNDAALSYQAILFLNADNLAVKLDFVCNIKANGAGFTNGIGIEIESLTPNQIESISGPVLTHGYISLNPNGTEANQDKAVVIFADDVDNILNETTISIRFVSPISASDLGAAPFNPFIIVNKVREKEIHLPYKSTTSLGTFSGGNQDTDGNFISDNGYPWAISIIHDFKVPKEKINITTAYNFFVNWASSGGLEYKDWYKDNPGNRNNDKLDD